MVFDVLFFLFYGSKHFLQSPGCNSNEDAQMILGYLECALHQHGIIKALLVNKCSWTTTGISEGLIDLVAFVKDAGLDSSVSFNVKTW